jgi:hypothetical protein
MREIMKLKSVDRLVITVVEELILCPRLNIPLARVIDSPILVFLRVDDFVSVAELLSIFDAKLRPQTCSQIVCT